MNFVKIIPLLFILLLITSCSTTRMYTYSVSEGSTICDKSNTDLGAVAILPEAAWRKDQKEPAKRKQMALDEIKSAFKGFPCGDVSSPGGVREFANWTVMPKQEMLKGFSNEGIDTIVIIRVEELTPRLAITFSIPFLWSGTNEADFNVSVISVKTGNTLADMRAKRVTGGPFNIRPAEWSRYELNAALHSVIN